MRSSASSPTAGQHSHSDGRIDGVVGGEQLRQPLARKVVDELDPLVAAEHDLEEAPHRLAERRRLGVAAEQGHPQPRVGDPGQRAGEVGDALAALEPAAVEQPQRAVARAAGRPRRVGGVGGQRMADADGRRDPIGAEVALVGAEHVAARPEEVVAVLERVALDLVGDPVLEVGRDVAVEDARQLAGRVRANADRRVGDPRGRRTAAPASVTKPSPR